MAGLCCWRLARLTHAGDFAEIDAFPPNLPRYGLGTSVVPRVFHVQLGVVELRSIQLGSIESALRRRIHVDADDRRIRVKRAGELPWLLVPTLRGLVPTELAN